MCFVPCYSSSATFLRTALDRFARDGFVLGDCCKSCTGWHLHLHQDNPRAVYWMIHEKLHSAWLFLPLLRNTSYACQHRYLIRSLLVEKWIFDLLPHYLRPTSDTKGTFYPLLLPSSGWSCRLTHPLPEKMITSMTSVDRSQTSK